jgi:Flp pilus assembly protein TadG
VLRRRAARARDRGSMAVEFVFLAPLLLVLMLFLVFAGRVVEAHSQVDGAARDAARAASIARTSGDAVAAADQAVRTDAGWCSSPPAVSGWTVGGAQPVTVTLTCALNMGFLGFGFGSVTVTGSAVAPMDPFVARN